MVAVNWGTFRRRLMWTMLPLGCLAVYDSAQSVSHAADDTTKSKEQIEEVVVTAQKRSEKLQDVPVAVTAITADQLEQAGVNTIQDVAKMTPNLVIIDQLRPGIQTVSFRGFTTVQGGQSPFTTIVDGVQQPGQEFLKQQLVDIEQVEVLRGPQGTLYGAGAIAGAINITTKKPTDDFEGSAKVGYYEGNQKTGTVTLSGPLVKDKVYFRTSAWGTDFDGLISNGGGGKDVDFMQEHAFQGELLMTPTDKLSISLRARYLHGRDGSLWLVPVDNDAFDDFSKGPATDIAGVDTRGLQTYSAKIDYQFEPFTLTSISAYNVANQSLYADGDFSTAPNFWQTWINNSRTYSEEIRLTSPNEQRLRWVTGLYLQDNTVDDITEFAAVGSSGAGTGHDDQYKSKSWALFGQATYDITDALMLTLGARYDQDKKTADNRANGESNGKTFSQAQPKATLSYKWTPDVMSYVTYAKGFRTGGFNPTSSIAAREYQNEVSDTFETGLKTTFLNNRLQLNGALFHTDFKNQQFFFSVASSSGIETAIQNIPKTEVNGVELEAQYILIPGLTLHGQVGYNNTRMRNFSDASGTYSGNRTPQVYGLTSGLAVEYTRPVYEDITLSTRVSLEHRGDVYWDLNNTLKTPAKDFIDGRIALEKDSAWTLALVGRNLTDERTPAAVGAYAFGTQSLRSANEPRQIGAELTVPFSL
ncbi:TonB-dependent receptor [Parvibaculum sp.]|uniref:TonB-dependent receptor n=1 Tax=Parvibaculum sp. TaxID=2024848 RepID=UPI002B98CB39|nr:TonB-dependent receptor [Parvibaculum sp.]HUD53487.1 TonB-dependent receptor [Parvibaculum sp.]